MSGEPGKYEEQLLLVAMQRHVGGLFHIGLNDIKGDQ
jgi:hypothetical protein